ncbi:GNAT family N-acetyltransferase [Bosea lathyri]|uniref:L-amino acid N-acyltransferase YncA n=1 Tax=Bosea lathyri TaxID=1036778 RepID=A0A1H6BWB8_9HYPH|nr:GNAT family N-acetyltransferase [Bosea lathyri]SEG64999.1 L-amino acid N-acyltransferase YncA [Bosea lathyri]
MFVRLALREDEDAVIEMATANARETMPGEPIDADVMHERFQEYLDTSFPTAFVVQDNGRLVGLLVADTGSYDHRTGFFVLQKVLYVSPDKRGTRAAVLLANELISYATRMGAVEIVGGNDNDFQSERTARFMERFGFRRVGFMMSKRLDGQHGPESQ